MRPAPGLSGWTSWMNWRRSPRFIKAVQSVAVLTVFNCARVCELSAMAAVLSENVRLARWRAKRRFEEIEVAALVGLLDVTREHPAIAALEAWRRRLAGGTPPRELVIRHVQPNAARRHVDADQVAI